MRKYYDIIKSVGLFKDIGGGELESMLKCLGAEIKSVSKNEILLLAGDKPQFVGVVLSGRLHIAREDRDGNRALIAAVTPGEIFAEALCCAGIAESPVTVAAEADSTVMLLGFSRILSTCPASCAHHKKLIENMLGLIARKNLLLQSRMEITGLKSVRAKVMRYLESFAQTQKTQINGQAVKIPFNRQEMADFLCVDRSALSHELARMKSEGLISYRKNEFILQKGSPRQVH